mmetsp:Transcript_20287/g.35662  ORF Transcript_20287/g.35662 Transcript_20287/m.35662 type:complete len:330 (+) Transcript_20287:790-1779(+)
MGSAAWPSKVTSSPTGVPGGGARGTTLLGSLASEAHRSMPALSMPTIARGFRLASTITSLPSSSSSRRYSTRPDTIVRGPLASPRSIFSTYSLSASGCLEISRILPVRISSRDSSVCSPVCCGFLGASSFFSAAGGGAAFSAFAGAASFFISASLAAGAGAGAMPSLPSTAASRAASLFTRVSSAASLPASTAAPAGAAAASAAGASGTGSGRASANFSSAASRSSSGVCATPSRAASASSRSCSPTSAPDICPVSASRTGWNSRLPLRPSRLPRPLRKAFQASGNPSAAAGSGSAPSRPAATRASATARKSSASSSSASPAAAVAASG